MNNTHHTIKDVTILLKQERETEDYIITTLESLIDDSVNGRISNLQDSINSFFPKKDTRIKDNLYGKEEQTRRYKLDKSFI